VVSEPTQRAQPGDEATGEGPRMLVLRFHSLGDCVLATGVTRELAVVGRVTVATEERFRPVFAGLPWLDGVLSREDLERGPGSAASATTTEESHRGPAPARIGGASDLRRTTADRSRARFDCVIDLQGTPGARWLGRSWGLETRSVRTRSAARRWLVLWGDRFPRPRVGHAVERYAEAAGLGRADALTTCRPEVRVTADEEAEARRLAPEAFAAPAGTALVIATGASRLSKEYPAGRFAEVARIARATGVATWWIEPPGARTDDARRDGGGSVAPTADMPVLRLPLGPLKAVLARARAVVVSDSGPMHLASALGVPVLGIFGSTVAGFGFAPLGPRARLLEAEDVACRPCGVHGRDRCWLGHWRCLRDLAPARVAAELLEMAGRT
jgi:ADP-heptose:LPS heptosyltransferase